MDGAVDWNGRPAIRSKTGSSVAAILILGNTNTHKNTNYNIINIIYLFNFTLFYAIIPIIKRLLLDEQW